MKKAEATSGVSLAFARLRHQTRNRRVREGLRAPVLAGSLRAHRCARRLVDRAIRGRRRWRPECSGLRLLQAPFLRNHSASVRRSVMLLVRAVAKRVGRECRANAVVMRFLMRAWRAFSLRSSIRGPSGQGREGDGYKRQSDNCSCEDHGYASDRDRIDHVYTLGNEKRASPVMFETAARPPHPARGLAGSAGDL
jgi:hypothetical protein